MKISWPIICTIFLMHLSVILYFFEPDLVHSAEMTKELENNVKEYLSENFGSIIKTPWYDNIIDINIKSDTVVVKTNLSKSSNQIQNICAALSGFIYSNDNLDFGITKVMILGRKGEVLLFRKNRQDDCIP